MVDDKGVTKLLNALCDLLYITGPVGLFQTLLLAYKGQY